MQCLVVLTFQARVLPHRRIRFSIPTAPQTSLSPIYARASLAVSPDGLQIAFLSVEKGVTQVWLRALDKPSPLPQRFLINTLLSDQSDEPTNVLVNWASGRN